MNAPDGTPTNAIYGYIKAVEKIIRDFAPDTLIAVFDSSGKSFRNEIYEEYKANRKECPEDLRPQFDIVKKYLMHRGIPAIEQQGFEADDLIGTLAKMGDEAGYEVIICTGDKDMLQLVNDNIKVCHTHKDNLMINKDNVTDVIGVTADKVIDYLSIVGDSSDNVPGLPGIGPKGAVKILTEHGTLENFLAADPTTLKGKRVIEAVTEHKEKAMLAKRLVTIDMDMELDRKIDDFKFSPIDYNQLAEFYEYYGMKQLSKGLKNIVDNNQEKPKSLVEILSEKQGQECSVEMVVYAPQPQKYEILKLTVRLNDKEYDLLEEGGEKTPLESIFKFKNIFAKQAFSFKGELSFLTASEIDDNSKQKLLTFDYIIACYLYNFDALYEQVEKFYDILMMSSLLAENDIYKIIEAQQKDINSISKKYILVDSPIKLDDCIRQVMRSKVVAVDTETTSLKVIDAELVGVGLSIAENKGYYIPLNSDLENNLIITKLKELLANPKVKVIGQNIKYDYNILRKYDIKIKNILFDTLIAGYLINPSSNTFNLDSLSLHYLNYKKIKTEELIGKGKKQITMDKVPVEDVAKYCCEDVDVTYQLYKILSPILQSYGLSKIFNDIDLPLVKVLSEMELNGIEVDAEALKTFSTQLEESIKNIELSIYDAVGHEFNINSSQQVGKVLFEELELKSGKKTSTGYSTDITVLEELAKDSEVVANIIRYRKLTKLKSTYADSLQKEINSKTNRIHTSFSQITAATGRLASTNPNLQNNPIRTEEGRRIRKAFKAKAGSKLLSCDYSQIELRVLAHMSDDEQLINAFNNDEDIHQYTASLIFDTPIDEVTKSQRYQSKAVNFGIIYGQGEYALSKELGVSVKDARSFIKNYFIRYPKIKDFIQSCQEHAKEYGFVTTEFDRKRFIPEVYHTRASIRKHGERISVNSPIQGTAADILKIAMINIDKELSKRNLKTKMLLQVHDELIFEVEETELDEVLTFVPRMMEEAVDFKVKLKVDVAIADNWAECD
jgi:DNA polymerase-1